MYSKVHNCFLIEAVFTKQHLESLLKYSINNNYFNQFKNAFGILESEIDIIYMSLKRTLYLYY